MRHILAIMLVLVDCAQSYCLPDTYTPKSYSNTYTPKSYSQKFSKLDKEDACEIAEVWGDYVLEGYGWHHSDVC